MNNANHESWHNIVIELKELEELLRSANDFADIVGKIGFAFGGTHDYFKNHFEQSKFQLQKMVAELSEWAEVNIKKIWTYRDIGYLSGIQA